MDVTVIIPTINARPDLLNRCIESVEPTLRTGDNLLVIEGGTFAENCNAGAKQAVNPILIFLNDDIKIDQDDWIDRLTDAFDDPETGAAGCRLIYPDGKLQHTGIYFDAPDGILTAHNRTWDTESGTVAAVTGACLAVRRDLFNELDGFDTAFRNGYEDVDLCLRIQQARYNIKYISDCTLIHHESQSGPARWEHVNENVARLQELWTVTD